MTRLLDGSERRFWLLGREVSVNGMVVARVHGSVDERALRAALDAAQHRHSRLRFRIDEGPPPRFVAGAGPVPLALLDGNALAWQAVAERELATRFASGPGPLLRATLLRGVAASDLILTWHHGLCDAFSIFALLEELLGSLAGEPPPAAPTDEPPLSELLPASRRGLAGRVAFLRDAQRFAVEQRRVRPEPLARDADAPPAARRSRIVQCCLDRHTTAALLARAKQEATTVQGALVAATLRAVRADAGRNLGLGCQQAVNLRPYLTRPIPQAFGLYSVGVPTFHHVGPQPFWDLARQARTALHSLLERQTPLLTAAYLEETIPRDASDGAIVERADHVELAAVAVTNLGRVDPPTLPGLLWQGFHGAPAVGVGNVLALAAVTFAGVLTCNFVTVEPLVTRARAERLADTAVTELRRAL